MFRRFRLTLVLLLLGIATLACTLTSPSATLTPRPTITSTLAPAVTNTADIASLASPTATTPADPGCVPTTTGVAYRVQPGDSLSALAARTNTTTNNLVSANCLANANVINVGQIIYLPQIPATNTPVPTDTGQMTILLVLPSSGSDLYNRSVQPNTTVTLSVGITGVTNVTFLANEQGQLAHALGISANPVSPATLLWQVPDRPGLILFLSAQGTTASGQTVTTPGLVRVTVSSLDTACAEAPTPRLRVNGLASVTPGLPSMLRAGPGTGSPVVNQLAGGTELLVLGGPTCAGGLNWWQVNCAACSGIQIGWAAEGQGATYWLEPKSSPASTN